jgi:hypothetical protein
LNRNNSALQIDQFHLHILLLTVCNLNRQYQRGWIWTLIIQKATH